ncbi:MAG TPA: aspartate aminotransferase, partial [Candidatus Aminicenantes bacterium]|nr:aspartate aminotransferase [Candidatus Aminicenantes bacterium]
PYRAKTMAPPKAGAIVFARYGLDVPSVELAERLVREQSVLVVPGDHFETEGFLRFGFGSDRAYLLQALARIDETLKKAGGTW